MQKLAVLVAILALCAVPAFAQEAGKEKKVDITGTWEITVESPQGTMIITANYQQEGETLTGTHVSEMGTNPLKGTVKGVDVVYTITIDMQGQQMAIVHTGKVDGDTMAGTADLGGMGSIGWTARRKK
jgi:hypothetical protein